VSDDLQYSLSIHPSFITPKQQNIKAHKIKAHNQTQIKT